MDPQVLFYLIIIFIVVDYLLDHVLSYLNSKSWELTAPTILQDLYDKEKYAKARSYHQTNRRFGILSGGISILTLLALFFFDGFMLLDNWLRGFTEHPILLALAFFGILSIGSDILSLPFQLYQTFMIEEKFGFNKMTLRTFFTDKIKSFLLGGLLSGGLLALLIFFYQLSGTYFWLYAWLLITIFSLFMATFAPSLIMPLFNKITPLEAGDLRTAIEAYAKKVNFPLNKIMVMDGSKRSSKANAFFTGLGSQKTIVLYDTLIAEQSTDELIAILAHEVGHYKKKHIPQSLVLSIVQMGIICYLIGLALNSPSISAALGAQQSFHISLIVFSILYSPIALFTGIFMNIFSRKNEFEADAYAKSTANATALSSALKKLSVNHLSNLTPHPSYVFVHYSHPPLLQRLAALNQQ